MFKPNNKILSTFWDQQQNLWDYDDVMEEYISNNPNSLINEVTYSKAKERISSSSCKSRHYKKQQQNMDFYTHGDKNTLYPKSKDETMNNDELSLGSTTPMSITVFDAV